ncbi:MAG: UDP-N-acetylmuramoyl-L-alanyl-D-glutamate--2,6-diaminopimelate ligase [Pseudomonadota bacterium]|nr:UDP-N-acetylmuramoyl-L-alanyl-D-glutamate--2,6-diaminopimelate ligase [Pseudomonadota bacterium]
MQPVVDREILAAELGSICRLEMDSRRVLPGDTFVAYPGGTQDGRNYIEQAIAKGAANVLWERNGYEWPEEWKVPNLGIRNLRQQAGEIASCVYGYPSRELYCIGITGTNGKTSSSHWIAKALSNYGRPCAIIGTLGNGFSEHLLPTQNTTPDVLLLHGLLKEYLAHGASAVAMEVSSHGLVQGRVNGVEFDVALFTNLSRDHLDFHGSMEAYAAAKASLFGWKGLRFAIINADDPYSQNMQDSVKGAQVLTYGFGDADIRGNVVEMGLQGIRMKLETPWGQAEIASELVGRFNASNLLGIIGVLLVSDVPLEAVVKQVYALQPVTGRFQKLGGEGMPKVIVDYAHTPDALGKVLETLRETLPQGGHLICVFGCGGGRDKGKRALMGEIAERWADMVVLTEDNSRYERVEDIIDDILQGMKKQCFVEKDRGQAIQLALEKAKAADVVLLAGKGHEVILEKNGERFPFSDVEKAHEAMIAWCRRRDGKKDV